MSLDSIRKSILSEAEAKASAIDSEANKESARIVKEAEDKAKEIMKSAHEDATKEAERLRKEAQAGADTEANSMLLEARGEVVERSLKKVLNAVENEVSKTSMKKLLDMSIKQFKEISGGNFIIKTSKKNAPLLKSTAYEVEYADVDGFMLYTDHGKIALNATVSSIVAHEADTARKIIGNEVFGGSERRSASMPKAKKHEKKVVKKAKAKSKAKSKKRR